MSKRNILLVIIDNRHLGLGLKDILNMLGGYSVTLIESEQDSLELLKSQQDNLPDVIIHRGIPFGDKAQLLRQVREIEYCTTIPFIIISLNRYPEIQNWMEEDANLRHIIHPFETKVLLSLVESLI